MAYKLLSILLQMVLDTLPARQAFDPDIAIEFGSPMVEKCSQGGIGVGGLSLVLLALILVFFIVFVIVKLVKIDKTVNSINNRLSNRKQP